jgi:hypothetical protein
VKAAILILSTILTFFGPYQLKAENITVSLITCGPGTAEAYQAYGHTAIRVQQPSQGIDEAYNYGVFDFQTPGFYEKFIKGKLLYYLNVEPFEYFIFSYVQQKRWVREQVLDLDSATIQKLVGALRENALPENKYYLYDFIYNNCSTQPRDLIREVLGEGFHYADVPKVNTSTLRQMIDEHMEYNEWLDFGIDLLLGRRLDKVADNDERMFLPAELMQAFDASTFLGKPLVAASAMLYVPEKQASGWIPGPGLVAWLLLAVLIIQQIYSSRLTQMRIFSVLYFGALGMIGWALVFMWWGTDHFMTKWNFNLLWAFPLHFPLALFLLKKQVPAWVRYYFLTHRLILIFMLVLWAFKPQEFHQAVIPISLIAIWAISKFLPIPKVLEQPE